MSLSTLLSEMEAFKAQEAELAKAAPQPDDPNGDADDDAIAAAAAEANDDNADQQLPGDAAPAAKTAKTSTSLEDGDDDDDDGDDDEDEDGALTKSFEVELPDGTRTKAFDATELIKSLSQDLAGMREEATNAMTEAFSLIKSQAAEIAGLKRQVTELGARGRGRKAVVTLADKSAAPLAKSSNGAAGEGMSRTEFFAKAATAQKAGRITAADASLAEAYLNKGLPVPERIVSRVIGG